MLKLYRIGTHIFQFEEGEQPEGAEEIVQPLPKQGAKKTKPTNKAREIKNK